MRWITKVKYLWGPLHFCVFSRISWAGTEMGGSHGFLFYLRGIKQVKELWGPFILCFLISWADTEVVGSRFYVIGGGILFILCRIIKNDTYTTVHNSGFASYFLYFVSSFVFKTSSMQKKKQKATKSINPIWFVNYSIWHRIKNRHQKSFCWLYYSFSSLSRVFDRKSC